MHRRMHRRMRLGRRSAGPAQGQRQRQRRAASFLARRRHATLRAGEYCKPQRWLRETKTARWAAESHRAAIKSTGRLDLRTRQKESAGRLWPNSWVGAMSSAALLPPQGGSSINRRGAERAPCCPRRHVLTMAGFAACFVMEVSRNFSVVVIPMAKEFGWDHATVGAIFASSYYGYTPMQIPSGVMAHHFSRPTLQIFCCMMLLMMLHAVIPFAVRGSGDPRVLYALMVPLGVAQALLNPSLHKLISSWAPVSERTRVHNSIYAGQNAGKMVSAFTSALIAAGSRTSWAWVFWSNAILCGTFGIAWICIVSDSPARDPRISAAERDFIRLSIHADAGAPSAEEHPSFFSLPWRQILSSLPFWAIVINHFAYDCE